MDKSLIIKMIKNTLKQYHAESNMLNNQDFENMYKKILYSKKESPESDMYDLVQDIVYGYITDSPYF
ncbi:YqzH family protein [Niallia sp. 03133]|uniref:YqzH family protein n=1 Tax=Niallia sp. 03133 TaxID=3458060 RepID=UPI0040444B2E